MVNHNIAILVYKNVIALFCAASIAVSPAAESSLRAPKGRSNLKEIASVASLPRNDRNEADALMKANLWKYLRKGLNYLEASGKEIPIDFKHPGGRAYGPLALTVIAIKDVKMHYPALASIRQEQILSDKRLYETFSILYADLLLRHYLKLNYYKMPKEKVFRALEKAWFLGPTIYKTGRAVIASRETKAIEYLTAPIL